MKKLTLSWLLVASLLFGGWLTVVPSAASPTMSILEYKKIAQPIFEQILYVRSVEEDIEIARICMGLDLDSETLSKFQSDFYDGVVVLSKAQEQLRNVNAALPWKFQVPRQCLPIDEALRQMATDQVYGIGLYIDLASGAGPMASSKLDRYLEVTGKNLIVLIYRWSDVYSANDAYDITYRYLPDWADELFVFQKTTEVSV